MVQVNYTFDDISKAWSDLSCYDKVSLLTFVSSELVNSIHTTNTYLLWLDMMNANQSSEISQVSCENTTENKQTNESVYGAQNPTTSNDEFQLLNALEIFWNINIDNIDLLKQSWGGKCATSDKKPNGTFPCSDHSSKLSEVDFSLLEHKKDIKGDVLTIKSDYLDNILNVCKTINPEIFKEHSHDLFIFSSVEQMHKYINSMIDVEMIKSWKEFETHLTHVIEYKLGLMFYGLDQIKQKEQYFNNIEQNDKELFELFNDERSKTNKKSTKKPKR